MPEMLKVLLVDDWEAVTKNNQVSQFHSRPCKYVSSNLVRSQLVPLPRSPNVVEILKEFEENVLSQPKPAYVLPC